MMTPRDSEAPHGDLELGDIYKQESTSLPLPPQGGEYTGEKNKLGQRHGRGRLVRMLNKQLTSASVVETDSLTVIEGMWENNLPHGLARLEVGGCVVYDGLWNRGCMLMQTTVRDDPPLQQAGGGGQEHTLLKAAEVLALQQSGLTERAEIRNLDENALEVLWNDGASRCTRRGNNAYFSGGAGAGEREESLARDLSAGHVHNPLGPEDLCGFVQLVLLWFFAATVFVMVIKQ